MGLFKKSIRLEDYLYSPKSSYKSKPREGFEPDAFTFNRLALMYVQLLASDWFDGNLKSIRDVFGHRRDIDVEKLIREESSDAENELALTGVQSSFLNTHVRFDNAHRISWNESSVGQAWQKCLESNGVTLYEVPVSHEPTVTKVFGPWQLFDDKTFLPLQGEAWADNATGEEFVYWFFDALVWNRYPQVAEGLHPSIAFYIPRVFQRLAYVSECSMPSLPMRMKTRAMEFGVESAEQAPRVAIHSERDYGVLSVSVGRQGTMAVSDWSPQTIRYGYILDKSTPFEANFDLAATVVDALPKVASMLADGYHQWLALAVAGSEEDLPYDFQEQLFNDEDLKSREAEWDVEVYFRNLFMPGTSYGQHVQDSLDNLNQITTLQADEKLMQGEDGKKVVWVAYQTLSRIGAAPYAMMAEDIFHRRLHAEMLPTLPVWDANDRDRARDVLRYIARYRVAYQDVSALSVLSSFENGFGETEAALAVAREALERLESPALGGNMIRIPFNQEDGLKYRLELLVAMAESYVEIDDYAEVTRLCSVIEEAAAAGSFNVDWILSSFRSWLASAGGSTPPTSI